MLLTRVIGTVVATKKDSRLEGKKLLVLEPVSPAGEPRGSGYLIALDTVGAGVGETVIAVQGSSARMAEGMKDTPVDCAVVGIVDKVDIEAPPAAARGSGPKRKRS